MCEVRSISRQPRKRESSTTTRGTPKGDDIVWPAWRYAVNTSVPIQVAGTSVIQVSVNNSPLSGNSSYNPFYTLGFSVDGVEIIVNNFFESVYNDLLGPSIPCDMSYQGSDAKIHIRLINLAYYANTSPAGDYSHSFQGIARGIDSTTNAAQLLGQEWYCGDLVLQDQLSFSLQIVPSPSSAFANPANSGGLAQSQYPCYRFPNVILEGQWPFKAGVTWSVFDLTFHALPQLQPSGTSVGNVLFSNICS